MTTRVLILDDSLTVRMDLAAAFDAAGCETTACATVSEARALLAETVVDVIVLDVLLPDGDGVELLAELRTTPVGRDAVVLMLSTEAEVADRVRGLRTGADEYVGKPYDSRYVVAKAHELHRARAEAPGDATTILLIDDSVTFREELRRACEDGGYRVLTAGTGEDGLRIAAVHRPDAIVVDGQLPDTDGGTVIRRIRLDAALRSVPCVLLTGSEDGSAELRALDAGADTFMRKEDDVSVVLARLGALLRHALPAVPAPGAERSTFGPKRILAVDDSLTYLNSLAEQLRGDGYDVVLAHSGEESLELLGAQPVDCILLDLMMPGLGGCETCRRVKSVPTLRDVPLIMLTAMEDHDSMIDALAAGADDYIQKSTEFEVLAARVRAQLRRKQFEDEHRRIREELLERELRDSEARQERALMQEQLMISDRMASVGVLAAGVAHEINNPLGAVLGNLVLAQQAIFGLDVSPASRPRLQEIIEEVRDALEAAQRIRDVAGDLKLFARSDADEQTAVDVQQVIESSIRMARNEIRHRARVSTSFKPVPTVRANASRLGQVFLNLIVNAAQAIPEGRADANEISVRTDVGDDGRVQVEVADTGSGIPPEVLDQLFTPFFTTKPVGVGTGLGLSICNRIIHSFGGTITVDSEVGVGSVFRVHLVAASDVDAATVVGTDVALPVASRRGRVLVIDDEPSIGLLVDRVLSPDHDVRSTTDANRALGWLEAGERFDVILCDLMMPQVTGMEFYERLHATVPEQADAVVFITGGAFTEAAVEFVEGLEQPLLEKPFDVAALRALVNDRL